MKFLTLVSIPSPPLLIFYITSIDLRALNNYLSAVSTRHPDGETSTGLSNPEVAQQTRWARRKQDWLSTSQSIPRRCLAAGYELRAGEQGGYTAQPFPRIGCAPPLQVLGSTGHCPC